MIVLADNSENIISDGSEYSLDEEDANAAIYSEEDLTLFGNGSLTVNGNYNDGITSKDGLIVAGGNITINAVDDGLRGKDYILFKSGSMTINANGDGMKSDNDEDTGAGYISVLDGTLNINSVGDAMQAETNVLIQSGDINLKSGGGSSSYLAADVSSKGIKSGLSIIVAAGSLTIDAADDAIHCDGSIANDGGIFTIASGDDGIRAGTDLYVSAGEINVTEAYEGLESALGSIVISDGTIHIVASDDGINVSAGGSSHSGGPGGRSRSMTESEYALKISGGKIVTDCNGDGLDSNDLLDISGGIMLVNSSDENENSALDYDGECMISGGILLAIGSSRMSKAPGTESTQYSFLVDFSSVISGGNMVHIQDASGNGVLTYKTIKGFDSIVFSSPELTKGEEYKIYLGGSSSGNVSDGLYTSGICSGGSLYASFTLSSIVTSKNL